MIVDEVMTAWGRIGHWFGIESWGVTPDIITTAKGITSGYATLAATIAREEIWAAIEETGVPFLAGHTMDLNPVSCVGALEVIRTVESLDLVSRSRDLGAYLLQRLHELLEFDIIGDVRGKGLMCGFEFVKDKATKEPFPPASKVSLRFQEAALRRGLVLFQCTGCVEGVAGDMILVTPPLVITQHEIDEMISIMKDALKELQAELRA